MAYNQQSEYPRGIFYSDLTAAIVVAGDSADTSAGGTTAPKVHVASIILSNTAAGATTVTITDDDDATIMVVQVPITATVVIHQGFHLSNGLKFAIDAATTHATVLYYTA